MDLWAAGRIEIFIQSTRPQSWALGGPREMLAYLKGWTDVLLCYLNESAVSLSGGTITGIYDP